MTLLDHDSSTRPLAVCVDDDPLWRRTVAVIAADAGFDVRCAETAEDGLMVVRCWDPAVVVMELALPNLSGFEAAHRLVRSPISSEIPLIAVTVLVSDQQMMMARNSGFSHVLTKPLDVGRFHKVLQSAIPTPNIETAGVVSRG